MPRGNMYLSQSEVRLIIAALTSMEEGLPLPSDVPDVDRIAAEHDLFAVQALRHKLTARDANGHS